MKRRNRLWTTILSGVVLLSAVSRFTLAQDSSPGSEPTPAQQTAPSPAESPQTAPPLTAAQLDQLTAPIALYSDPLLGLVLTAATYPLEVVEAARWVAEPDHAPLKGEALAAALQRQDWDTSVKGLVEAPQVLQMMNQHLEWTEELGDAFLSQQADVMDSIQRLRQRAAAAGALKSSPEQSVSDEDGEVIIEPPTPDVIYVPCYAPVIYGPWPWTGYPPFFFPFPTDYCYSGPVITFGFGFALFGPYWGWDRWNWRGHGLYVYGGRPHGNPGRPWNHDPEHRRGVPYPNAATARRFLGSNAGGWRGFRGYPAAAGGFRSGTIPRVAPDPARRFYQGRPPVSRPGPPMFESYGSGARARTEGARGAFSRASPGPRGAPGGRPGGGAPRGGGGRPH